MGLAASFTVTAVGSGQQFQWSKNGVAIVSATTSSYLTPPTTFEDTGASFTVAISNSAGTVMSTAASLTVTARAPLAGDLRFQQVDAASTVNGYGNGGTAVDAMLPGLGAKAYALSLGTPLWVSGTGDCSAASVTIGANCAWAYSALPLPSSMTRLDLIAGYGSDSYSNFQYDLADPNWPNAGDEASPAATSSVVTSLDLEPASQLFALSWAEVPSSQQGFFDVATHTVAAAELQASATQEGANSRVITALSVDTGGITYISYGWSADPLTAYEAQVSTASLGDAQSAASALAAAGYIITAIGRADDSGDVMLVGTRVKGDTMARPFIEAQGTGEVQTMMLEGYATVGIIVNSGQSGSHSYLGER